MSFYCIALVVIMKSYCEWQYANFLFNLFPSCIIFGTIPWYSISNSKLLFGTFFIIFSELKTTRNTWETFRPHFFITWIVSRPIILLRRTTVSRHDCYVKMIFKNDLDFWLVTTIPLYWFINHFFMILMKTMHW